MTLWEAVAGLTCIRCNTNPATCFYGRSGPICCQCLGGDIISPEEAQAAHDKILARRKEEESNAE